VTKTGTKQEKTSTQTGQSQHLEVQGKQKTYTRARFRWEKSGGKAMACTGATREPA